MSVCQFTETPAQAMHRFHSPAHLDQAAYYSDVGSAGTSLRVYHPVITNKSEIKLLSLSGVFAYVCVCVGVYSMLLLLPSSEMQQPSKSQFRKLLCFTHITVLHLHSLHEFDYISG